MRNNTNVQASATCDVQVQVFLPGNIVLTLLAQVCASPCYERCACARKKPATPAFCGEKMQPQAADDHDKTCRQPAPLQRGKSARDTREHDARTQFTFSG
jgi:hypothetical protein